MAIIPIHAMTREVVLALVLVLVLELSVSVETYQNKRIHNWQPVNLQFVAEIRIVIQCHSIL